MKYRVLGKTGLRVSVIGVGTWQYGGEWGRDYTAEEVRRILARAHDLGLNLLDTAECYGDHLSERLIGEAIAGRRDEWIIATKFGHKYLGHLQRSEPRAAKDVLAQLEDSLRALRTEVIDLYQYHSWGNKAFENADVREALARAQQAGKIRHIGASISPADNVQQTDLADTYNVAAIQVVYNRLERRAEVAVLPSCVRQNLGVLARVPLASGLLSGKYAPGAKFTNPHDVRASMDAKQLEERLRQVEEVRREVPAGVGMAEWALAWCLRNPAVATVIPGCKSVEQVESNARAADLVP